MISSAVFTKYDIFSSCKYDIFSCFDQVSSAALCQGNVSLLFQHDTQQPCLTLSLVQVLQNVDELFDREELSASPDPGWPDCFNSGVFVYRPSDVTYQSLQQFAIDHGSFDGEPFSRLNVLF